MGEQPSIHFEVSSPPPPIKRRQGPKMCSEPVCSIFCLSDNWVNHTSGDILWGGTTLHLGARGKARVFFLFDEEQENELLFLTGRIVVSFDAIQSQRCFGISSTETSSVLLIGLVLRQRCFAIWLQFLVVMVRSSTLEIQTATSPSWSRTFFAYFQNPKPIFFSFPLSRWTFILQISTNVGYHKCSEGMMMFIAFCAQWCGIWWGLNTFLFLQLLDLVLFSGFMRRCCIGCCIRGAWVCFCIKIHPIPLKKGLGNQG